MEPSDYRALIQDRKSKQRRPFVRHVICLDDDLYAELAEAQADLNAAIIAEQQARDEDRPQDRRAGGLSPRLQAEARVAEVEARMAEVSVVGVFKVLSSTQQAELIDRAVNQNEEHPERGNQIAEELSRENILSTFDHFEGPGGQRIDLTRDDLIDMMATWSHGQTISLSTKITRAATEAHDAPKSVRLSLQNRPSAAT